MQPDKQERVSLKDFIDDHQKILAVVGVFMALSIFFANSTRLKEISVFISFLCFAATIPLLLQIYYDCTRMKLSWLLWIFINIFAPLSVYVFWYLLMAYRPVWKTQTSNVLLWLFIFSFWYLFKRFRLQANFAKVIERLMMSRLKKMTEKALVKRRQKVEELIENLSDEEKNQRREAEKILDKKFREEFAEKDLQTSIRDSRIAANTLIGIGVFIMCSFISNRVAAVVNPPLDKMYESYIQAEASPTPPATPTPMTSPSPSPSPSASPTTAPTPSPTETPTPSKRRKR